ncbi:hypothetical protein D1872_239360 [compost metagenome]
MLTTQRECYQSDHFRQIAFPHSDDIEQPIIYCRPGSKLFKPTHRIRICNQEEHKLVVDHFLTRCLDDQLLWCKADHLLHTFKIIRQLANHRFELARNFIRKLG